MSKNIGLFGGTFDPIHNGHLYIARAFLNSGHIDELWVLLTPNPPHKENDQTPYKIRLSMLQEAFGNIEQVSINTIENELPKPSYSVQTIRHLKDKYPETTFYFCMGEDSLAQFNSWKYYNEILDECELLVARRPGATHEEVEEQILRRTHFVDHNPKDISSTGIKEMVAAGKTITGLVPESVAKIIEKEQLYS